MNKQEKRWESIYSSTKRENTVEETCNNINEFHPFKPFQTNLRQCLIALVIVLISHSGFSSSTSAHVFGSDEQKHKKKLFNYRGEHRFYSQICICVFLFTHSKAQQFLYSGVHANDPVQALLIDTWKQERRRGYLRNRKVVVFFYTQHHSKIACEAVTENQTAQI